MTIREIWHGYFGPNFLLKVSVEYFYFKAHLHLCEKNKIHAKKIFFASILSLTKNFVASSFYVLLHVIDNIFSCSRLGHRNIVFFVLSCSSYETPQQFRELNSSKEKKHKHSTASTYTQPSANNKLKFKILFRNKIPKWLLKSLSTCDLNFIIWDHLFTSKHTKLNIFQSSSLYFWNLIELNTKSKQIL